MVEIFPLPCLITCLQKNNFTDDAINFYHEHGTGKQKYFQVFISKIFLEMLQRYCKIVWVMPIKKDSINLQKTLVFICMQKINFIITSFLRYCKGIAYLILSTFDMPGNTQKHENINQQKTFMFICTKNQLHPHFFANLLYWVLWVYANQNVQYQLVGKTDICINTKNQLHPFLSS